jgi:hypothetical protein
MKHFQKRPRCQGKASINTDRYQMNVEVNEEQVKGKQKIIIYTLVLEGKFNKFHPILILNFRIGVSNVFV